jgi:ABC-2 type transport system permease protein
MRLKYLLQKEFTQIRRNPFMARVIVLMPIVQMLILVPAVTFDIKNIRVSILDRDHSPISRGLINQLEGSPFFRIEQDASTIEQAQNAMNRGKVDAILSIPAGFERDLIKRDAAQIQLLVNGINGTLAQNATAFLSTLIRDYNREIILENIAIKPVQPAPQINILNRFWYNPGLDYRIYMAPGILAILVTSIGFLLSGLNLVREKEIGTSEQINVTPIKKHEFILGKMIPFMVIGMVDLAFGLFLARLAYGLPFEGNLLLLFGFSIIYLIAVMGLGLFLSTFASTQQQYLFICFFFMIILVLMSGIFTPDESMPRWAQKINLLNPAAYFIRVARMVLLKGSGFKDVLRDFLLIGLIALSTTALASMKYKKTV